MKNKSIRLLVLSILPLFFFTLVSCAVSFEARPAQKETIESTNEYPRSMGCVYDFAEIFNKEDIENMNKTIIDLESKTNVEIVVATIKSLNDESIEKCCAELFDSWEIGKNNGGNGVLFLIAPNERKCRIEIGKGLKYIIPNSVAATIIDEIAVPRFKNKEYGTGSYEVVEKLSEEILAAGKQ